MFCTMRLGIGAGFSGGTQRTQVQCPPVPRAQSSGVHLG
jgi:hypothetical protein